ncbi:hypothetical protein MUK42_00897 [Musa troglodytarum]|uniref:Uncharacterized protein n=1 Tax=Musa troglodytarum TaxID=320322 RepID=A0A9E7GIF4_9LILI|nr:hypothetical protein MUK42_00897 [Musa troglodytarum]
MLRTCDPTTKWSFTGHEADLLHRTATDGTSRFPCLSLSLSFEDDDDEDDDLERTAEEKP